MTDHDPKQPPAVKLTGFGQQLQDHFGPVADPHVSLEPPPAEEGYEPGELFQDRLDRLSNLTPGEFRYQAKGELGRGGMGVVMRVWDRDLRRHLAMKVVTAKGTSTDGQTPTNTSQLTRFLEEAQITGQLDHPGVVPVHELGMDARGRCFFTMRMVKGNDLKTVFEAIHSEQPASDPVLANWTRNRALSAVHRVCETMAFAHTKGVIHRDLKPANIMVGRFGETYVMDWGLAKVQGREESRDLRLRGNGEAPIDFVRTDRMQEADADPDSPLVTMDGDVLGTPAYMPPEQARGDLEKVNSQADIYSMGAILYHLLSGRAPYSEPDEKVGPHITLMRVLSSPPARLHHIQKDVPSELAAICEKAMAYDCRERYATMLELAEDLSAFLEGRVVQAHQTGSIAEFKKWVERNRSFAAVIITATLILLGTLGRISFLKSAANEVLGLKNAELTASNLEAAANAQRALANEALANEAKTLAESSAQEALRQIYISNIQAATLSLRVDDPRSAAEFLEQAKGQFAGWEWSQLNLALDSSLATWPAQINQGQRVAFSPNGLWIASIGSRSRNGIDLRHVRTGQLAPSLTGHNGSVTALAFSPDSKFLASAATDKSIRIWEVATGRSVSIPNTHAVTDLSFSPNGSRLAVATRSIGRRPGSIKVFDRYAAPLLVPVTHYDCETGSATALMYGPHGKRLIVGSDAGLVQLWDTTTHSLVAKLDTALSPVTSIAINPSGSLFAVTTRDGVLRVAKTDDGAVVANRSLGIACANDCEFLDDDRLALACSDNTLRVYDPSDRSLTSVFGHATELTGVAVSGLGSTMATASRDGTVKLWSGHSFLPTSEFVGQTSIVRSLAFDSDGEVLASSAEDGRIWIWDAVSGEVKHTLLGHSQYVPAIAFSHQGTWIASGSGDQTIRIWNAHSGELSSIWTGHTKWISDLAFSPDDRYVASSSGDKTLRVWDLQSGECIAVLEGHQNWVHCLAWSPDGTRLMSAGGDGVALEWDPFHNEITERYPITEKALTDIAFIPNQDAFVVSCLDSSLRVIEIGGEQLHKLERHHEGVSALTLNPDGSRLVSGGMDGSLLIWDTADWALLTDLHTGEVNLKKIVQRPIHAMTFSPDGSRLATSQGSQVLTWETSERRSSHEAVLSARSMADMVSQLFKNFGLPSQVIESLKSNTSITRQIREAAIQFTKAASQNPELLSQQAWRILLDQDAGSEAYASAFDLANMVQELEPDNPKSHGVMAAALYRTGHYKEAAGALGNLLTPLGPAAPDRKPVLHIFRAMSLQKLGLSDQARRELESLREPMLRPAWQKRAGTLFAEAEELIGSGD